MKNKLLSIGSVVLLKEADKRIMVIGYYPTFLEEEKEITYDYSGCLFPEGVFDSQSTMLFNHKDIDKIYYYGLMDEEQGDFMDRLKQAVEEEQNLPNESKQSSQQDFSNSIVQSNGFQSNQDNNNNVNIIQPQPQNTMIQSSVNQNVVNPNITQSGQSFMTPNNPNQLDTNQGTN